MWPDHLDINVSRESVERLEQYHALLLKWQKAINLVSPNTIDDAWVRHFADSAQIERYVPRETKVLADLGCGGGFPGLVLAMMRPEISYHFVESDDRKCQFMRTVSRETKLCDSKRAESNVDITVHNLRIENAIAVIKPDIITARALASLSVLLDCVWPWARENKKLECLFLKGANVGAEIDEAYQSYNFDCEQYPSLTDSAGRILRIKNITRKSTDSSV